MDNEPELDRTLLRTLRRRGPQGPWVHVLSAVLQFAGPHAALLRHSEKSWASVTFCGSRHTVALQFEGASAVADGEAFIAALGDHEFSIPRHFVAEAALVSAETVLLPAPQLTVEVELLLLEEAA